MAAVINGKPCVGFFKMKCYKIFDAVNALCDNRNIEHYNDYTDKSFLVYVFSIEDAKQVLKYAKNWNVNSCIFVNYIKN